MTSRSRQRCSLLGTAALAAAVLIGGLVGGPAAGSPATARPTPGEATAIGSPAAHTRAALDLDVYQSRVLRLVNHRRTAHGLHPVRRISPCVDRLSESWATHLADTGDFVHRDQHVVLDRCHMHWAGETLARGTGMLPGGAVTAWMHSPEHRAVLLKPRANRAGMGVALDGQGRTVLVLNFTDTRG